MSSTYQVGDVSKLFGTSNDEEASSSSLIVVPNQPKKTEDDDFISNLKKRAIDNEDQDDDDSASSDKETKKKPKKKKTKVEPSKKKRKEEKRKEKEESEESDNEEENQTEQKTKYDAREGEIEIEDEIHDSEKEDKDDDTFKSKRKRLTKKEKKEIRKKDDNTVFVSNFPIPLEDKNLKKSKQLVTKLFSVYGTIESVRFRSLCYEKSKIPTRKGHLASGLRTKDYGNVYIHFEEMNTPMEKIISDLNGKILNGRHLNVDDANHTSITKEDKERSVFIQNLPFEIDDEEIWETIGSEFPIYRIRIVRDPISGKCKGFGYVQFKDKETAETLLKTMKSRKPHIIQGRKLEILKCKV
ncbi:hypothetical protein FDP41_000228 [Naegleria fowleri]|uniref:RRM domain-containing protein n=1 Tax=Naegleria fowleri TaxID=5763 RepID=A0A6A5CIT1_NAEFO|nr:uncharacterized protein FDP41_000228 [Naegleria fowleri]KAF0985189.1 hypothetical protein FDP41_000228 [Naegleria fowleri]